MLKGEVLPVKLYVRNDEWGVDIRRVVAYRASCACGWRSRGRATMREARAELREHRQTH